MKNKDVLIIGNLMNAQIENEIEKAAIACNVSFIELKEEVEEFANKCELATICMNEINDAIKLCSNQFRLIDYPKERTSVIPPNFYRKRF